VDCWSANKKNNKSDKLDRKGGNSESDKSSKGWSLTSDLFEEMNTLTFDLFEVLNLETTILDKILFSASDMHTWLLDSGATFHRTPEREWFTTYSKTNGKVRLGNAQELQIEGIGDIEI
jgi:hypothetical protein